MADYLGIENDVPDNLPEFATDNVVDPLSGKNNVVSPSADQKSFGWFPFRKRPERGVMNWLHRSTYQCIDFLQNTFYPAVDFALEGIDGRVTTLESEIGGTLDVSLFLIRDQSQPTFGWTTPGPNSVAVPRVGDQRYLDFTIRWVKLRRILFLIIPEATCAVNLGTHSDCVMHFNNIIPSAFDSLKLYQKMNCLVYNPPVGLLNGYLQWSIDGILPIRTEVSLSGGTVVNTIEDFICQRAIGSLAGLPCQTIVGAFE